MTDSPERPDAARLAALLAKLDALVANGELAPWVRDDMLILLREAPPTAALREALETISRRSRVGPPAPPNPKSPPSPWYNLVIELGQIARAALARAEGEPLLELRYEAHVLDQMADHIWGMFARRLKPDSVPPPEMDRGMWRDEMRKLAAMVCDSIATSAPAPDASPEERA